MSSFLLLDLELDESELDVEDELDEDEEECLRFLLFLDFDRDFRVLLADADGDSDLFRDRPIIISDESHVVQNSINVLLAKSFLMEADILFLQITKFLLKRTFSNYSSL